MKRWIMNKIFGPFKSRRDIRPTGNRAEQVARLREALKKRDS